MLRLNTYILKVVIAITLCFAQVSEAEQLLLETQCDSCDESYDDIQMNLNTRLKIKLEPIHSLSNSIKIHKEVGRPILELYSITKINHYSINGEIDLNSAHSMNEILSSLLKTAHGFDQNTLSIFCELNNINEEKCSTELLDLIIDNSTSDQAPLSKIMRLLEYSSQVFEQSSEQDKEFANSSSEIKSWIDQTFSGSNKSFSMDYVENYLDQTCLFVISNSEAATICYEVNH